MAAEDSPAFQFYPKDWLSSSRVMLMTLAEEGAYVRLLCIAWLSGSIPAEIPELAKLCRVTPRQMAVLWKAVGPCFDTLPGDPKRLVNLRLEEERDKQASFREMAKARGAKGAQGRWNKHPSSILEASAKHDLSIDQALLENGSSSSSSSSTPVEEREEGDARGNSDPEARPKTGAPPPDPGPAKKTKGRKEPPFDPRTVSIPPILDTPEFRVAWEKRIRERSERPAKDHLRPSQTESKLEKLASLAERYGVDAAIGCVVRATGSGWAGEVYPEDEAGTRRLPINGNGAPPPPAEPAPWETEPVWFEDDRHPDGGFWSCRGPDGACYQESIWESRWGPWPVSPEGWQSKWGPFPADGGRPAVKPSEFMDRAKTQRTNSFNGARPMELHA